MTGRKFNTLLVDKYMGPNGILLIVLQVFCIAIISLCLLNTLRTLCKHKLLFFKVCKSFVC